MKTNWIAALCMVAASACAVEDVVDGQSEESATTVQVSIDEVGYGGTAVINDVAAIIYPEYFVVANYGATAANLGGYYLTDGASWGGDGLAKLPSGTVVPPGDAIVVANYPPVTNWEAAAGYAQVSFEDAYGYAPDVEIKGWDPAVPDADTIKGRVRLSEQESVMLIEVGLASDEDVVWMLENDSLPEDVIESTYPRID